MTRPEPFLLANHILGPSYVSMESALSHYGLIPEVVYEVSSVTTKASRKFDTSLAVFSFTRLPLPYYAFGICQVSLSEDEMLLGDFDLGTMKIWVEAAPKRQSLSMIIKAIERLRV